ncbi:MAG: hypothetical protein K0R46_1610 [Herbinix sp.]|jgi:hypothetical protein|nr:hypothetical protein [Herbinix sp.]
MKKLTLAILISLILISMSGCNKGKDSNVDNLTPTPQPIVTLPAEVTPGEEEIEDGVGEEEPLTVSDYFPLEADTEYIYEGEGNEYAAYHRYVDYIDLENNLVQTRTDNGGTVTVRVLQIKDGTLSVVYLANESYYRDNFMDKATDTEAEVLLMEPLKKGTNWTLSDGRRRLISEEKVPISTPYGSFDALEVTTESEDSTTKDYYAVEVGLVKSVFLSEGMEVSSTLKAVNKDAAMKQMIMMYYPDADEKIYTRQLELSLKTGEELRTVLEAAMQKTPPKDTYIPLMSVNTRINSISLDENNIVQVDFTKEFVTEANLGSGYELLLLQSVTNTLGYYFGATKVVITIEGKPYESGHVMMEEGEAFEVDVEDVVS